MAISEPKGGSMEDGETKNAINGLFEEDGARDYIVVSKGISRDLHVQLSQILDQSKKNTSVTLFLTTHGGDPDAGYRIARCLRHHYKDVRLAIAGPCKSAGTLVAIAATTLAIGDLGELGPLDIQVRKPMELWENSSGLDIQQALQTVTEHVENSFHRMLVSTRNASGLSTKLCAEFAGRVASAIAAPLFAQIDPIRLGEMQRATRVAYSYGLRLNGYTKNLKGEALEKLISDYPAHGFVIDRKEAGELFNRVSPLSNAERVFCSHYSGLFSRQADFGPWFLNKDPTAQGGNDEPDGEGIREQGQEHREPARDDAQGGEGEGGSRPAAEADE